MRIINWEYPIVVGKNEKLTISVENLDEFMKVTLRAEKNDEKDISEEK